MGVPIAVKYSVFTGALLAIFMVALGVVAYRTAVEAVDREINDKGFKLARLSANTIDPYWSNPSLDDGVRSTAAERLRSKLQGYISEGAAAGIIDILVYTPDRQNIITSATERAQLRISQSRRVESALAAEWGIEVSTSTVDQGTAVRSYSTAIERDGEVRGWIDVFVSIESVERTKSDLQNTTIIWVTVAVLFGLGVSVFVGSFLTRPIRVLKQDMMVAASGDLTHQSAVRTGDELESLALTFNRMTGHLASAQEQEASRKALERELAIATTIQTALLPNRIPVIEGYDLFPHYESAKEVGGDYYDFIPLGETRHGIVVADVSGKGIPGSLVMTMTRSLMRMAARTSDHPAEILVRVNASLSRDMTRGMFVTLIFADFDRNTGRVRLARAGHNPAYLYRHSQRQLVQVQPDGIALGIDGGELFRSTLKVQEFSLEPGDVLVLYTDGIIEAMDTEGVEYTPERFAQVIANCHDQGAREIVSTVVADVDRHARGAEPSDDMTLIVLKRSV